MSAFLKVQNLQRRLGGFELGPLALELEAAAYLVLLGPTGCGKTSLLRLLAGSLGPTAAGSVWLDGTDISRWPPHRRRVACVAQASDLFPHLTVAQNVAFGLRFLPLSSAEKEGRLGRYLELFGLTSQADQLAATLSGGEGKKTAMARSLVVQPRLLLLDEPLGMLDHNERRELLRTLIRIQRELRTTTIHVTHDRQEAWASGRHCGVMRAGRIEQTGAVAAVFRKPVSRWAADFLGAANLFEAHRLTAAGGEAAAGAGWAMLRPEQIALAPPGAPAQAVGTLRALRDLGDHVEVEVELETGLTLTVHATWNEAARAQVGQPVCLSWPPEALHRLTN